MYNNIQALINALNCQQEDGMALLEVLNLFAGKWRMIILAPLFLRNMRFTELQQLIPNITPRMLSKELKELEMSGIVTRTIYDDKFVLIQYSISNFARELEPIIRQLVEWGMRHRMNAKGLNG